MTMLDAMMRAAHTSGERGVTFHATPDASTRVTFAELDQNARMDAVYLDEQGARPGDRILLAFEPGLEFLRAAYAVMYAGLVAVPLADNAISASGAENARRIAADCGALMILCDEARASEVALDGVVQAKLCPADRNATTSWQRPDTVAADIALLQYTSGSTGNPKGVSVTHANLIANQKAISDLAAHDQDSVLVGWLPHYHDMGFGMLMQPIYGGFDLVMTSPRQFLRRPEVWLRLIDRYAATTTVGPDFAYRLCAQVIPQHRVDDLDLSRLRTAITGAEPVRASTVAAFTRRFADAGFSPAAFVAAYGMAETTLLVTAAREAGGPGVLHVDEHDLAQGVAVEVARERGRPIVSCGVPAADHTVILVGEEGLPLGEAHVGEIWVAGPSVTAGYHGNREATTATFGARVPDDPTAYLRTGDLGFLSGGQLYVTGRMKDVIIVRGRNVYPSDIEDSLQAVIPGVRDVMAAAFQWNGEGVGIVVETNPQAVLDLDDVRRVVAQKFSLDRVTAIAVRRGTIPRTTSGKVRRAATREALEAARIRPIGVVGPDAGAVHLAEATSA